MFGSITSGNGISCACGKRNIINFIERNRKAYRIACNVGRCDRMRLIVRLHGIFSVFERDRLAVHPYGKVVFVGNGEIGRAVVFSAILNARDNRCFGVGRLNIAATAELFVGTRFPYAGVGVAYDLDISRNGHTAVNNFACIHIFKRRTVCKAV